ncbi:MAG: DNA recombination protein RmuC [Usitatibacter sp.]
METQSLLVALLWMVGVLAAGVAWLIFTVRSGQESRHRAMLSDLHAGLSSSADRIASRQSEEGDRLRRAVSEELERNRNQLQVFEKGMAETVDKRLDEIGGKVTERLDLGFKRTNDTFLSVMTRLQTIDDAQKKIETLTGSVVSLQQLLGSKSSRGALGERQLEDIIKNYLPESAYELQYTFRTVALRADCVLKLPEPTGLLAIDSKFQLENYERMISEGPDKVTPGVFKADVRRHIDSISSKYIIPGETSDGAVMFIPAESVFAEIHAHHRDLVEYAQQRRVWMVSPTTLMAVVNTVRSVIRDVETRKQIHIIKDELGKLGKEFGRFDERMKKLADHIRQANDDVRDVAVTSKKISDKFAAIERAELPGGEALAPPAGAPQLSVVPKPE